MNLDIAMILLELIKLKGEVLHATSIFKITLDRFSLETKLFQDQNNWSPGQKANNSSMNFY
jgi:hypothetical protein